MPIRNHYAKSIAETKKAIIFAPETKTKPIKLKKILTYKNY